MTKHDGALRALEGFMPFPAAPQVIPDVRLSRREFLCWRPGGTKPIASFERLLHDFVDLTDARGVLEFTMKYGPLYLCSEHKRPVMHRLDRVLCPPHFKSGVNDLELSEPVAAYLGFSRMARALLGVADKATSGKTITADEWIKCGLAGSYTAHAVRAGGTSNAPSRLPFPTHGFEAKRMVEGLVNMWLMWGDPRPRVALRADGRFEAQFVSGNQTISGVPKELEPAAAQLANGLLFAALAMQLVSAVSGGLGLATCSNCGVFYVPKRAPAQSRRHFCPKCGPRAAWRLSKQTARRK
jgi:hypothetical protein